MRGRTDHRGNMRGDRVERRAEIRQRRLPIRGWGGGLRTRPTGRHRVNVVGEQARRRSARSLPRSRLEGIQWAVISARHALPWCCKRVVQLHVKLSPRGEAGNRNKHDFVCETWEWLPIRALQSWLRIRVTSYSSNRSPSPARASSASLRLLTRCRTPTAPTRQRGTGCGRSCWLQHHLRRRSCRTSASSK